MHRRSQDAICLGCWRSTARLCFAPQNVSRWRCRAAHGKILLCSILSCLQFSFYSKYEQSEHGMVLHSTQYQSLALHMI